MAKAKKHGPVATYFRRVLAERIEAYPADQKVLARELGVSESTISLWKSGDRGIRFEPDDIVAIARAFKMSTDQLFGITPPPPVDIGALDAAIQAAETMLAALKQLRGDRS